MNRLTNDEVMAELAGAKGQAREARSRVEQLTGEAVMRGILHADALLDPEADKPYTVLADGSIEIVVPLSEPLEAAE